MSMNEELPNIDLPAFDERSTRWAVRRAILRTAATAVVGVLVVLAVLGVASTAWSARGKDRMLFIMGRAYQAANPGYLVNFYGPGHSRLDFGTEMEGSAQALEPGGFSSSGLTVTVSQRFYGHIAGHTGLTKTHIDELF